MALSVVSVVVVVVVGEPDGEGVGDDGSSLRLRPRHGQETSLQHSSKFSSA